MSVAPQERSSIQISSFCWRITFAHSGNPGGSLEVAGCHRVATPAWIPATAIRSPRCGTGTSRRAYRAAVTLLGLVAAFTEPRYALTLSTHTATPSATELPADKAAAESDSTETVTVGPVCSHWTFCCTEDTPGDESSGRRSATLPPPSLAGGRVADAKTATTFAHH